MSDRLGVVAYLCLKRKIFELRWIIYDYYGGNRTILSFHLFSLSFAFL